MGRDIQAIKISGEDRRRYRDKVRRSLDVFARMLRERLFEEHPSTVGQEIELNLVDEHGMPSMRNADVLDAIASPVWATEVGQFNLEINVPPRVLDGDALATLETELRADLNAADTRARTVGSHLVMVGILPTLAEHDVNEGTMSANERYRVLNEQIFAARGEDMSISIDGPEQLLTHADSITPEAACTSVQLHLQVSPDAFADYWNAAQAIAGVQVALAANSPFLFGRQLWHETRITLFEQATDTRPDELKEQGVRPRVWFGERWITSVFDLFEENLRYFPALLPICEEEDPLAVLDRGSIPQLAEMTTVGQEIELNLVDEHGLPSMRNADVLDAIASPVWATEVGQFNLEINVPPRMLDGDALATLETELRADLNAADTRARTVGSHLVMVGILPTLAEHDVSEGTMSANERYRVLNEQIFAARGEDMSISIDGREQLLTHADSITPEAACTSVQLHLQVSPDAFADYWNAAQAIAGVQVALAANSPFLFGRQLWHETRITLFEQATDTRPDELKEQGVRPRVWFGERWITSVFDLFEENLRYFPALLPICEEEDPLAVLDRGSIPQLAEMNLHNGTVYRWNRPVYGVVSDRPHLRVENRVLPAGPTIADVVANAAFYYGLVRSLAEAQRPIWTQMSFTTAAENLHEAARHGLDAQLYWPGVGDTPVSELILRRLLPLAHEGLARWGVDEAVAARLLGIIEQRCLTGQTGAVWQMSTVAELTSRNGLDRREALRQMTQRYIEHMHSNEPVHTWSVGLGLVSQRSLASAFLASASR